MQEIFEQKLSDLLGSTKGKVLFFLKGFDLPQLEYLIRHPNSILSDESLIADGVLDISGLEQREEELVQAIQNMKGPLVGFYEEMLILRKRLPELEVKKTIVLENNFLAPWTPGLLPYQDELDLFDYFQLEHDSDSEKILRLIRYYGDVRLLEEKRVLLAPLPVDPRIASVQLFWNPVEMLPDIDCMEDSDDAAFVELDSDQDWLYSLGLLRGQRNPALFLHHGNLDSERLPALSGAMKELGIEHAFDEADLYIGRRVYDEAPFLDLLRRYWGRSSSFRSLLFYRDPESSLDTETISQGQIVAEIADQCTLALNGERFRNIFITAPTGAGKSLLFQLPAMYLAEKYKLVTIVVSPLIALMNDQVDQLQREHGVTIAACINSSMTLEERYTIIEKIKTGDISLLYLAPELLLTMKLQNFLGNRTIGLLVIDEAHTVTSWGRDFRSDYWFLGDFIRNARRSGFLFPVLCLTATAVYSGEDDVVNDTIRELGLGRTILHLGNVRRANISFDIVRHTKKQTLDANENEKKTLIREQTLKYVEADEKVLAYFPYRSQVDESYREFPSREFTRVRRYHAGLSAEVRKQAEDSYKSGEARALLCTKAFGMGIDVGDIRHVIHFAPTGNLSDYVQEIGRAARDQDIQGIAHIDYFPTDMHYVRTLNSLSEMRQYQLGEMLKKLADLYLAAQSPNLIVTSETFEYLFRDDDAINRTKAGLMLLARDLEDRYHFPVLVVRPRALLSKNYVCVPKEIEKDFLDRYGDLAQLQEGTSNRVIPARSQWGSVTTVTSLGDVFLVNMVGVWEQFFPDMEYGMFRRQFFETTTKVKGRDYRLARRVKAEIRYKDSFTVIKERMETITNAIHNVFMQFRRSETRMFTAREFQTAIHDALGEDLLPHDNMLLLLDIFTAPPETPTARNINRNDFRVLQRKKMPGGDEMAYSVTSKITRVKIPTLFGQHLNQCFPNQDYNTFSRFYPVNKDRPIEIMPLLRIMELLGLASYEIRGGESAEVFVRINDANCLLALAEDKKKYVNYVLRNLHNHHSNSQKLLDAFFMTEMTTDERWELIERYFLGNADYINSALSLV